MAVQKSKTSKSASPKSKRRPRAQGGKARAEVAKPKKTSALDAAAKVLAEAGGPLNSKEMVERMASKGYWRSPAGKTPSATLYSSMLRQKFRENAVISTLSDHQTGQCRFASLVASFASFNRHCLRHCFASICIALHRQPVPDDGHDANDGVPGKLRGGVNSARTPQKD